MEKVYIFLIFILIYTFIINNSYSQDIDIAILCDVSLSLKSSELNEGKNAIIKLLENGVISQGWELSSDNTFPFITQKTSPLRIGSNLVLLSFGTILSDNFPYFSEHLSINIQSLKQVNDFLEENFPTKVEEQWTYEFLAEAVISNIMVEQFKSKEWYLFVLSDFIESHGFSMTDEQTSLLDKYLEGKDLKFSPPAILRWKQRPDLQIKIVKLTANGIPHDGKLILLTPQDDYKFKDAKTINFIWKWEGNLEKVTNFILVVRKKERKNYKVLLQQRLQLERYIYKKPSAGNYEWFVTSNTNEGTSRSEIRKFQVKGATIYPWLLLLLVMFVIVIAFFRFGLPKLQSITKRRKKYES